MVWLCDIMDLDLLDEMIEQGYVTARPFDGTYPWVILNYTPKAQYEWVWNEVTLQARGLVYKTDETGVRGEVIARPFKKFFNWDQGVGKETWHNPMPPGGVCIRMEKMDGSLGILCANYDEEGYVFGEWVATRGSFHSEQAKWATGFYYDTVIEQTNNTPNPFEPVQGKTYLFEIIYPENRIVVDYGDYKGLVLLDVIDNETGHSDLEEFDNCNWPDKVKKTLLTDGFDSGQAADIPDGDEGFVYYWPRYNFRVKMKSAEYIELHRIVSNLSEKTIWEQLMQHKTVSQIQAGVPDEFHEFVETAANKIMTEAAQTMTKVAEEFAAIKFIMQQKYEKKEDVPRKEWASYFVTSANKKYLFAMLDGKEIWDMALADAKPKNSKPLVSEEEV